MAQGGNFTTGRPSFSTSIRVILFRITITPLCLIGLITEHTHPGVESFSTPMLADSGVSSQFSEWQEQSSRFRLANKRILSPIIWAGYTHQRFLTILKGDATTANCTRPCVDARCICPSSFAVVAGSFIIAAKNKLSRFRLPTLYQTIGQLSSTFLWLSSGAR